jgi:hypothetical protein
MSKPASSQYFLLSVQLSAQGHRKIKYPTTTKKNTNYLRHMQPIFKCTLLKHTKKLADNQRTKSQCDIDQEDGKETG